MSTVIREYTQGMFHPSACVIRGFVVRRRVSVNRKASIFQKIPFATLACKRNIDMTPLCKVEVTLPRVLGSREVRRGGGVDEQASLLSRCAFHLNHDPLDLIEAELVAPPVVELRRSRRGVVRHRRGLFKRPA